MPKLSKEEIIRLYKKPFSMGINEISRESGYFNSPFLIKKIIQEGLDSGIITEEDQEVFSKREELREKQKRETKENLKSLVHHKILKAKTREEIVREIKAETDIEINTAVVGNLIKQLIQEGILKKEEYEKILKTIRKNATRKTKLKNDRKREKGLEL